MVNVSPYGNKAGDVPLVIVSGRQILDAARHLVEVPGPTPIRSQVGTNGAMLLYAVATNDSAAAAADRLLEMSGRFAGGE